MNDMELARLNMVESQVRPSDVTDRRVLLALSVLPREIFVPGSMRSMAYMDEDILIKPAESDGAARYLMAPRVLGKLIQLAEVNSGDFVLDVGCGSGYSTAVLSSLCDSVVGLEVDEDLAAQADKHLNELKLDNFVILQGKLNEGLADEGPYDVIVVNGSIAKDPEVLLGQLKEGGRLVSIVADGEFGKAHIYKRIEGHVSKRVAFDASAFLLPGFEKAREFVF